MSEQVGETGGNAPSYGVWAAVVILSITALRVVGLLASPLDLHGDEAQYFAWSRDLAGGYYSKPPGIAWVIAASTALFGTEEWAVRVWSPVVHGLAAGAVHLAGRRLFDERTGFWAALAYLTLPGVVVSAGIASTDALLLLCVGVVMWAWAELRQQRDDRPWLWVAVLAVAMGLGLMSKYAMIYCLVALALIWMVDGSTRAVLTPGRLLAVGAGVGLVVLPNVLWNLDNGLATVGHTVDNANLDGAESGLGSLLEFWGSQLGVAGPVLLVVMLVGGWRGRRDPRVLALLIWTVLPLVVVSQVAWVSRANANWAASAFVPGALLAATTLPRAMEEGWKKLRSWFGAGVGVNALAALVLSVLTLSPGLADAVGAANSFKRVRGWEATVDGVAARADAISAKTVAIDNRITFYALDYYGLDAAYPLRAWQMGAQPDHQAERTHPLLEGAEEPILFVNYHREHLDRVRADFAVLEPLEPVRVELGGGKVRELNVYRAEGYRRAARKAGR